MSSITSVCDQSFNDDTLPAANEAANITAPLSKWSTIPVPVPRPRVMARLRDLAMVAGGQSTPLYFGGNGEVGALRLPKLGASLFGTACSMPLLNEEAEQFREITNDHVFVLRLDDRAEHGCDFTVDILLSYAKCWLLRYRLWQHQHDSDFWFVPTQGEARSLRITHGMLALSPRAPFFCPFERNHGFDLAAERLQAFRGGC